MCSVQPHIFPPIALFSLPHPQYALLDPRETPVKEEVYSHFSFMKVQPTATMTCRNSTNSDHSPEQKTDGPLVGSHVLIHLRNPPCRSKQNEPENPVPRPLMSEETALPRLNSSPVSAQREPINSSSDNPAGAFVSRETALPGPADPSRKPLKGSSEDTARERLKRHQIEVAGRVWIPDSWAQEELLNDWIDCTAFESSLVPSGIMSARAALVEEGRRANSSRLRIKTQV